MAKKIVVLDGYTLNPGDLNWDGFKKFAPIETHDRTEPAKILERSKVHLGLKHYFLVNFPQEPGALRRFLDQVLGPNDDITLFEYVKRNNREIGPALIGVELGSAADYDGLLTRMAASDIDAEVLAPDSPAYRYLINP